MITFSTQYEPNGIATNAASANIVVTDNTTSTVVYSGAMSHVGTGVYQYDYASEVAGHVYQGVMTLVGTNAATIVSEQVIFVQQNAIVPASNDDGSSSYDESVLPLMRAQTFNTFMAASAAISIALANGPAPNYSISSRLGSESMSMESFIAAMEVLKSTALSEREAITEMLQKQQPFDLRQQVGIRGRWQG